MTVRLVNVAAPRSGMNLATSPETNETFAEISVKQRLAISPILQILDDQGDGEGQKLTRAQIHEIGLRAVEKALGLQPDELRPWAEPAVAGLPANERQLEPVS